MVIKSKLLNEGENVVFSTRTHVKVLVVPVVTLLVVAAAAGWLSSLPEENKGIWLSIIWGLAAIVILVRVVWPFLIWYAATYTFTDRRLTTHSGVFTRRGHDIPLSRISDVSYEKSLIDRLFGCGTLLVTDASEIGQVQLHDVPKVSQRQLEIAELLHRQDGGDH